MIIESATILQFSVACVAIIGAIAGCIHGSRCTEIKCCGCSLTRTVPAEDTPSPAETELT
jgi:hypothetical protein